MPTALAQNLPAQTLEGHCIARPRPLVLWSPMDSEFLIFVLVGFAAQLVDGALGMAYGVISSSVLLSIGVPPAAASAAVHASEVVTTGISGASHAMFKNIDRGLFVRIAIPGVIGGIVGAFLLTNLPADSIKPFVAAYLLIMGLLILRKALRPIPPPQAPRALIPLGLAGGFFDAIGGGGWGPIVTSTLLAQGTQPRYAIGSVNLSEFFLAIATSATFIAAIGLDYWRLALALLIGGAIAAPLAAYAAGRVPAKPLMLLVATVIILLSARNIWLALA